jgi:hypothetical protein
MVVRQDRQKENVEKLSDRNFRIDRATIEKNALTKNE